MVEGKGAGPQTAVSQVLRDLRNIGHYDKVVIRPDQEPSIMDLLKGVAKERGAATVWVMGPEPFLSYEPCVVRHDHEPRNMRRASNA